MSEAYRTGDMAAENEALKARIAELEAKPRPKKTPWTDDQRETAQSFAVVVSILSALISGAVGVAQMIEERQHTVGWVLFGVCACSMWFAASAMTRHWDWWRGIFEE